ncbi:MAG TPA: hypothetical protein VML75_04365 [Kofleriaceae bacterium]|nr:hypothetical protein [Kofleriaceae bacterium]
MSKGLVVADIDLDAGVIVTIVDVALVGVDIVGLISPSILSLSKDAVILILIILSLSLSKDAVILILISPSILSLSKDIGPGTGGVGGLLARTVIPLALRWPWIERRVSASAAAAGDEQHEQGQVQPAPVTHMGAPDVPWTPTKR